MDRNPPQHPGSCVCMVRGPISIHRCRFCLDSRLPGCAPRAAHLDQRSCGRCSTAAPRPTAKLLAPTRSNAASPCAIHSMDLLHGAQTCPSPRDVSTNPADQSALLRGARALYSPPCGWQPVAPRAEGASGTTHPERRSEWCCGPAAGAREDAGRCPRHAASAAGSRPTAIGRRCRRGFPERRPAVLIFPATDDSARG